MDTTNIEMKNKLLNKKMLLISIIGTLESIKVGVLSVNETEKFLFSPYMVQRLKEKKYNEAIINLLEEGCELEDILSLLPENLEKEIERMKYNAFKEINKYEAFEKKFWI